MRIQILFFLSCGLAIFFVIGLTGIVREIGKKGTEETKTALEQEQARRNSLDEQQRAQEQDEAQKYLKDPKNQKDYIEKEIGKLEVTKQAKEGKLSEIGQKKLDDFYTRLEVTQEKELVVKTDEQLQKEITQLSIQLEKLYQPGVVAGTSDQNMTLQSALDGQRMDVFSDTLKKTVDAQQSEYQKTEQLSSALNIVEGVADIQVKGAGLISIRQLLDQEWSGTLDSAEYQALSYKLTLVQDATRRTVAQSISTRLAAESGSESQAAKKVVDDNLEVIQKDSIEPERPTQIAQDQLESVQEFGDVSLPVSDQGWAEYLWSSVQAGQTVTSRAYTYVYDTITNPVETITSSAAYTAQTQANFLKKGADVLSNVGQVLVKSEDTLNSTIDVIEKTNEFLQKDWKTKAYIVAKYSLKNKPSKREMANSPSVLKKVLDVSKTAWGKTTEALQSDFVRSAAQRAGELGRTLQEVSGGVKSAGESLAVAAEELSSSAEARDLKQKIIEIDTLIQGERDRVDLENLEKNQTTFIQKLKQRMSTYGQKMVTWAKDVFTGGQKDIVTARSEYSRARTSLLSALGIAADEKGGFSSKVFADSLRAASQDPEVKKNVEKKLSELQSALKNVTGAQQKIVDQLESGVAQFKLIVDGWDKVAIEQKDVMAKQDLVDTIAQAFDYRNQRLSYLHVVKGLADQIKQDLAGIDKTGLNTLPDAFVDKLERMVSGQLIGTIADFDAEIGLLDNVLVDAQKQVTTALSAEDALSGIGSGGL